MSWRSALGRVLDARTLSRRVLNRELPGSIPTGPVGTVLDVGGASGIRYRRLVRCERYWTVDVQPHNRPNVVGDAHRLPFVDRSVDLVLCLQVLEHCRRPADVFREIHRVLAPGGRLVLSTVLVYELHGSPHDFYRFTEAALRDLAHDFAEVEVRTLGNRFVAAYDLTMARSLAFNSLFGRMAYRMGTAPSASCPCGFILECVKSR